MQETPVQFLGSGRSAGERIRYPLQYSLASFVAQLVKNPPAMWETWIRSLDWEDPLEKGMATLLRSRRVGSQHQPGKSFLFFPTAATRLYL